MSAAPPTPAATLRRHWLGRAFEAAGIDASRWDPASGVAENRRTIESVYDYYGRLYLAHAQLEWAGMANMIGPSFYAGFLDIGFVPDRARRLLRRLRSLLASGWSRLGRLLGRNSTVEQVIVGDLGFFETTFLTMQRKIFEDQALMHEAYLDGRLDAIHELGAAGIIDAATVHAWEQIDSGDPARVNAGNRTLLYREQHDILEGFYLDMREHSPPSGRAFTYALTLAGTPAVPGAKSYRDVFPLTLFAPFSRRARIGLQTPLAAGNLALFTNRWKLIEQDTLPIYQRLISEQLAEARSLIERPVARRAGRFRLLRRAGRIVLAGFTRWRVLFEEAPEIPVPGEEAVIDLTTPPTREDVGFGEASDSRTWTNLQRRPFRVSVALPGGRSFSTEAVLAVLSSADPGRSPNRFTLKLPATDLAGVQRTLARLAAEWQLDEAEIAAWVKRAAAVTTASHVYGTRVFRARSIEFVRLELQVEHHVEQDAYVRCTGWRRRRTSCPSTSSRRNPTCRPSPASRRRASRRRPRSRPRSRHGARSRSSRR